MSQASCIFYLNCIISYVKNKNRGLFHRNVSMSEIFSRTKTPKQTTKKYKRIMNANIFKQELDMHEQILLNEISALLVNWKEG